MKQTVCLLLCIAVMGLMTVGCTGSGPLSKVSEGKGRVPQPTDSLYTERAAMDVYGTQPERALMIIDSAEMVGNLTKNRASLLRAKVLCLTCGEERLDTARQICETLLQDNFVKDEPAYREPVLDLLVTISRKKHDNVQWLRWATEKADFCRQQGNETEALRTEAEIGIILTHLGRQDEGMAKLDDVIHRLDGTRKFNETDACIIALKRKINVLQEEGCYAEIIAPAKRIVEKVNSYEQHPDDYHDGSYREPDAADVPGYCAFYRSQAYGFLANAFANTGNHADARHYLTLFEQSPYGQTFDGRKMIAPTWCKLGDFDKMLAVYDEMERRMGADTIGFDYAAILHDRAEAAYALGAANSQFSIVNDQLKKAYDYMSRHAALSQALNDSLQASEAHMYAARYHAQEQQLLIEREQAKSARKNIYIWSFVIISLLAIAIAAILFFRNREIRRKNRILAQQIAEALTAKEQLREKQQTVPSADCPADPSMLSDADLFRYLSTIIEREQLFLDPACDRQMLTDRFRLSKERVGAAFAQGSSHERLTAYIRELRLDYAVRLMNERPELSVEQVSQASGFTSADTFTRNFRTKYGMTPTAYRRTRK